MPSPNFDSLHLYLSRKIVDPVAAAATDGVTCTSAMRTDYLNRANRLIQNILWKSDSDPDYPIISRFLQGLVSSHPFVFSTSGASLPTDYSRPLWVDYSMRLFYREPSVWSRVLTDDARFYNSMFTVYGNKIYGTFGGSALGTGNGVLYYVASDMRVSSGDTLDIALDSIWWDILVDIAASMYHQDRGNTQFVIQDPAQLILSVVK